MPHHIPMRTGPGGLPRFDGRTVSFMTSGERWLVMFKQACPHCGARYQFEENAAGRRARCKKCGDPFTVEVPESEDAGPIPLMADDGFWDEASQAAEKATAPVAVAPGAAALTTPPMTAAAAPPYNAPPTSRTTLPRRDEEGDATGGLIPYKNPQALIAYYLGIFSFIPLLGVLIGLAALILGIGGLRYRKKHPKVHGTVHAWIGILVGGGFMLLWGAVVVLVIVSMVVASAN